MDPVEDSTVSFILLLHRQYIILSGVSDLCCILSRLCLATKHVERFPDARVTLVWNGMARGLILPGHLVHQHVVKKFPKYNRADSGHEFSSVRNGFVHTASLMNSF